MSEYTTITSTTTRQPVVAVSSEPVTGPSLLEAAYGGKVAFHKERSTGTLRRWPVLAPKSEGRKHAESLRAEIEKAKGGVTAVAKKHNVSVATLRRTLVALSFTEELEGLTAKQRTEYAKAATSNMKVEAPKAEPKPEPEAPKAETPKAAPKAKPASKATTAKEHAAKMRREAAATVKAAKAAKATPAK
jgi:DNA polymerase III gamma/tau subunit